MYTINIPGSAGTAMALAAGVSIYSAAKVTDIHLAILFLVMTFIFIVATYYIEKMHLKSNPKCDELLEEYKKSKM